MGPRLPPLPQNKCVEISSKEQGLSQLINSCQAWLLRRHAVVPNICGLCQPVSNLFNIRQHFGEMPFQLTFTTKAVGDLPPLGPGDNSIMIFSYVCPSPSPSSKGLIKWHFCSLSSFGFPKVDKKRGKEEAIGCQGLAWKTIEEPAGSRPSTPATWCDINCALNYSPCLLTLSLQSDQ